MCFENSLDLISCDPMDISLLVHLTEKFCSTPLAVYYIQVGICQHLRCDQVKKVINIIKGKAINIGDLCQLSFQNLNLCLSLCYQFNILWTQKNLNELGGSYYLKLNQLSFSLSPHLVFPLPPLSILNLSTLPPHPLPLYFIPSLLLPPLFFLIFHIQLCSLWV